MRVVCGSREPRRRAGRRGRAMRERIDAPDATVLGPAPLFRLRGRERAQVVVKAPERASGRARGGRRRWRPSRPSPAGRRASFSVDVDPQ